MDTQPVTRRQTHAGSWYSDSPRLLRQTLATWLEDVKHDTPESCVGIIVPHAGYRYSGPTAAHAYKRIQPTTVTRVVVLGPSHANLSSGCLLTQATMIETPLGALHVDLEMIRTLEETGIFDQLMPEDDEREHSLEMQFPYIKHVFQDSQVKVVPIVVGNLADKAFEKYARVLEEFVRDPQTLFVVSSDFCHWGERFGFQPYDKTCGQIWESISKMDHDAMDLISNQDIDGFTKYLKQTRNTICGRKPITLYLHILKTAGIDVDISFVHYAQSSQCTKKSHSSVSYAAAVISSQ